jgi:hypothetical protein
MLRFLSIFFLAKWPFVWTVKDVLACGLANGSVQFYDGASWEKTAELKVREFFCY